MTAGLARMIAARAAMTGPSQPRSQPRRRPLGPMRPAGTLPTPFPPWPMLLPRKRPAAAHRGRPIDPARTARGPTVRLAMTLIAGHADRPRPT
jgi:hypothetical protein